MTSDYLHIYEVLVKTEKEHQQKMDDKRLNKGATYDAASVTPCLLGTP